MKQDWSCGKKTKYLVFNFLYTHWDCGCWVHSLKIAISGGVALGWTISKATVRAVTLWRPPRWLFWMWLVTVRVNTDCLIGVHDCRVLPEQMQCSISLGKTVGFGRTGSRFPRYVPGESEQLCEILWWAQKCSVLIFFSFSFFFSRSTLKTASNNRASATIFILVVHTVHSANAREQACCNSSWMLTNIFSLEVWAQQADILKLSRLQQYFYTREKFWATSELKYKFVTEVLHRMPIGLRPISPMCSTMAYSLSLYSSYIT